MNRPNPKYFKIGITIFLSLSGVILFYYLLFFGADLKYTIANFFKIFSSIILGIGLAYLLNPMMIFIEEKIITKIVDKLKKPDKSYKNEFKIKRSISVLLTMILFGYILYGLVIMIVPQVIGSIQNIIFRIPQYLTNLDTWSSEFLDKNPDLKDLSDKYWIDVENWFTSSAVPKLQEFVSKASTSVVGSVLSIFSGVINFIVGIIVSIYLLASKETFCAQAKKITYALFAEERANNLINNTRYAHKIFGGFISGKLVDSILIGIICYISMLVLKMPYSALISVIVGVTNIIPYFGPFIGAIPCAIIILMVNPVKCLTFLIFILILQQFDGNILGPKILGDSTGLNSFWVIFAITVFSGFFGVVGMFIGVPVFAVIYAAFKTFINERLAKKKLPVSTTYYKNNDYHSDRIANSGRELRFVKRTFENIYPEAEIAEESTAAFQTDNVDDSDVKPQKDQVDSPIGDDVKNEY